MIDETLLRKQIEGNLSDEEIIRAQIAAERSKIEVEAKRRADQKLIAETNEKHRQNIIEKLIFLDRQSELHCRNFAMLRREKEKLIADLEEREKLAFDDWEKSASAFKQTFVEIVPEISGFYGLEYREKEIIRQNIENVKAELKRRGAKCEASCFSTSDIGQSPIETKNSPLHQYDDEPEPPKKAA